MNICLILTVIFFKICNFLLCEILAVIFEKNVYFEKPKQM
jgi:hypothetical protein